MGSITGRGRVGERRKERKRWPRRSLIVRSRT
jgi:hypothetical protein